MAIQGDTMGFRMRQAAAKATTTSNDAISDEIGRISTIADAKRMLLVSTIDMSWRLALVVLVPVFIGIWADSRFDTKPALSLAAFVLAIAGASVLIARTYKQLQAQADKLPKSKRKPKTVKGYDDEDELDY